jgi:hypothetical protein
MEFGAYSGARRFTKAVDDDPSEENQPVHLEKI